MYLLHRHLRIAGAFLVLGAVFTTLCGCGKQPVAIVNGSKITQAEFVDRLEKASGHEVLADMINRELLEKAFASSGLQITAKEVDDEIAKIQSQFPDAAAFQQFLTSRGATLDDVKKDITFNLKLEKLCTQGVQATDQELQAFFTKYQKRYDKPDRVTISEIVVATPEDAQQVKAAVAKQGADFAALAKQYSVSPATRDKGGMRPETPANQIMPQALQPVVAKLQVGQVSDPVPAEGGQYYILKLDKRTPAEKADYNTVKADVERDYKRSKAKAPDQLLSELREKAAVTIVSTRYQDLAEVFRPKTKLPTFGETKGGKAPAGQPGAAKGQPTAAPTAAPAGQQPPAQPDASQPTMPAAPPAAGK